MVLHATAVNILGEVEGYDETERTPVSLSIHCPLGLSTHPQLCFSREQLDSIGSFTRYSDPNTFPSWDGLAPVGYACRAERGSVPALLLPPPPLTRQGDIRSLPPCG